MIINTVNGTSIDTAKDFEPAERHIVQKLLAWTATVESVAQFRGLKKKALDNGWKILSECFKPEETNFRTELIEKFWPK